LLAWHKGTARSSKLTLNGVGGLLAMHRTADLDALYAALNAGQPSTILSPKNAIENAAQILAGPEAIFPTAQSVSCSARSR
jgi:hypothetical protein